jgi:hypothetical protein
MTNLPVNTTSTKHSSLNEDVTTWAFYPTTTATTATTTTTTENDLNILDTYNFNNWNTSCQNWESMLDTFIPPPPPPSNNNNENHHHHKTMMIKNEPSSDHTMSLPPTPPLQSPTHPIFNIDFFNPPPPPAPPTATTTTIQSPYVYTTANSYKDITPPPSSNCNNTLNHTMIKMEEMDLQSLIHPQQSIHHPLSTSSCSSISSSNSIPSLSPSSSQTPSSLSSSQSSSLPSSTQFQPINYINNHDDHNCTNNENNTNNHNHNHNHTIMKYRRRASDHTTHRQPRQQRRRSTHPSVASVVSLTAHEPISSFIDGIEHITFLYSHDRLVKEYTIRTDVDSVDLDMIPLSFRGQNTIYPRANVEKEEYTGNRWNYESSCNILGWKLCWLNQQQLCGKRGLIQRAVDSYRNRHAEMRSRRVTRQEKVANGTLRKRRSKKSIS